MSRGLVVVLCFSMSLGTGVAPAAAPYYFTVLNPLGTDINSWADGMALVNGAPEAVGISGGVSGGHSIWEPVSWNSSGAVTNLLPLIPGATAGALNVANGIDSDGDIVGRTVVGGVTSAFYIPSGGTGVVLPPLDPSSPSACATGVSDSGLVVGYSTATDGNGHAFVWSQTGGMIDLGTSGVSSSATGISADGNTIIGDIGPAGQAVEWTRSGSIWTMTTLIGRSVLNQSFPAAINSSGDIVGGAYMPSINGMPPSPSEVAFEWQPGGGGTVVNLGNSIPGVGGPGIGACGINDSGVVVGGVTGIAGGAFINYTGAPGGNISL
jgi:probable HAF family extracellular repeat protein